MLKRLSVYLGDGKQGGKENWNDNANSGGNEKGVCEYRH